MLDWQLTRWVEELTVAEMFRDRHLSHWDSIIERMTGPDYRGEGNEAGDPENFVHQYLALILPRLVYDNPRVRVSSRTPAAHLIFGKQLQAGLNTWCRVTRSRDTMSRIALDMLAAFGVGMVVHEPAASQRVVDGGQPWLPRLYRLDPADFLIDPQASHIEDARYVGHTYRLDRDDLLARAETESGWDVELLDRISGDDGGWSARMGDREGPDRDQLTIYEIWVPELDTGMEAVDAAADTDLHNGTILTIVKGQGNSDEPDYHGFVREPQPYYGPRHGPYVLFGCYAVPGDPYPLSPLIPLLPQVADLNDHLRSMTHSASTYKRIIATDSRNQKLANDIRDRDDLTVVLVDGLDPSQVVPFEVGGITPQQVSYAGLTQDRLDRVSGIHDAMRGNITGTATATEINVAESAAGLRLAHLKREFAEGVARMIEVVAWYMFHDGRVLLAAGETNDGAMLANAVFVGGTGVGMFEDLLISVDAMSMSRVSETQQQQRAIELLQVVGGLSQQMAVAPWVDWRQVLDTVGDALNVPELSSMLDPSKLQEAAEQQQAMAMAGGGARSRAASPPSPRNGRGDA